MGGNCGFAKSDAAKDELAKLPLENDSIAILKTRRYRQPRQGCGQNRVVREPEQVERLPARLRRIARIDGALQRRYESRSDQVGDLAVQEPRKLAVLEMARGHEAQALRLLLVGTVRDVDEVADHAADQLDQRRRRRLLSEQM